MAQVATVTAGGDSGLVVLPSPGFVTIFPPHPTKLANSTHIGNARLTLSVRARLGGAPRRPLRSILLVNELALDLPLSAMVRKLD